MTIGTSQWGKASRQAKVNVGYFGTNEQRQKGIQHAGKVEQQQSLPSMPNRP
jgi:hypothetical protein